MSGSGPRGAGRRRRHRRVDAPATRAGTDGSDDLPGPDRTGGVDPETRPGNTPTAGEARGALGARDAWIVAQRPPHWD
ncbi:MAG TPA: hypothetical protein VLO09_08870 [Ornithinimicrobium sp.]|nr:hypothetical protein [Ornithinimicrobium sp.]